MITKISAIHNSLKGPNKANGCFLNNFGRSQEFQEELNNLVKTKVLSKAHMYIDIQLLIRKQNECKRSLSTSPHHSTPASEDSSALGIGNANVRYVAGVNVGRVLHEETQHVCRNIFSTPPDLQHRKNFETRLRNDLYASLSIAKIKVRTRQPRRYNPQTGKIWTPNHR